MKQVANRRLQKLGVESIPESWGEVKLKHILERAYLGGNYPNSETNEGLPLIKMGNIGRGSIVLDKIDYLPQALDVFSDHFLHKGDLLFNTRNTLDLVGKVSVWSNELPKAVCNSNLLKIFFKKDKVFSNYFMNYVFNSYYVVKQLRVIATGTTSVAAVYSRDLKNITILLPSLEEQKRIEFILSTWDKVIEKTKKLMEAKRRIKKGLIQKLLSKKIRFKDFKDEKWQEMPLSKFLKFTPRPMPKPNASYRSLGLRSHGKGVFGKSVRNYNSVMMDTLYKVKEDDLIVNITFAWEGAIAVISKADEDGLVSHRFPTFVFNREIVLPEYFKQVIQAKRFVYHLGLVSPGGAGRNRVLNKKDFLKLLVFVPQSISEQKKIATVLNAIDEEIIVLERELMLLNKQKRSLMQKLLAGKIRVKV